jgi:hypothetical protein
MKIDHIVYCNLLQGQDNVASYEFVTLWLQTSKPGIVRVIKCIQSGGGET